MESPLGACQGIEFTDARLLELEESPAVDYRPGFEGGVTPGGQVPLPENLAIA